MKCPVCQQDLRPAAYKRVALHSCPGCSGVWCSAGRLAAVVRDERDLPASAAPAQVREKRCPECPLPLPMEERAYTSGEPLLVDICACCHGVWLDGGELQQVLRLHRQLRRRQEAHDADAARALDSLQAARRQQQIADSTAPLLACVVVLAALWFAYGAEAYARLRALPYHQALACVGGVLALGCIGLFFHWLDVNGDGKFQL